MPSTTFVPSAAYTASVSPGSAPSTPICCVPGTVRNVAGSSETVVVGAAVVDAAVDSAVVGDESPLSLQAATTRHNDTTSATRRFPMKGSLAFLLSPTRMER